MYETGVKVEESLLKAEVALLTGGRDINGRPLVTFPAATIDKLAEVGSAGLVQVIRYYFSVSNPADRQQGFTFVADLQNSSQESNQVLVEALDFLQTEKRGSVSNFYALKPKSRAKSRCLKKQLGLKESKKNPKVASYPSSVLKIQSELYSRIDRTQLAPELGGTLQHNQHAWIQFHHMLDPLMEAVSRCQNLLPGAKDRVLLLQDYDTAGMTSYQLQTLMRELEDKYHGIMRELDVESTIDWSRQMAQRLQKPADEVVLSKVSPQLLKGTIDVLKQASQDLVQGREEMTSIWKDTENHFQKLHQLFHFKRDTTALCDDIARLWMPKVDQPANIGSTLSQAEMYRTYFISSLYDPAKVLVSEATELLEGIQHLHQDTPSLESELDFVPGLAQLVQTFAEKLERLHNTYMAIHIFYLMFEKLAQWYQKVLRFIPSTLGSQVEKAKKQGKSSIPVLPKWAQAVRSFLNKHPGPRNEHISRIEYPVSILPDAQLCSQARLLAHRIRSLNKLLTSTQQFPLPEIANALSWKRRSLEGNDDIVIPSQVDPPLNKSYNTERDLDREVAEIGCVTDRTDDGKSEPFERPATALGLIDKKTQSVTFADELDSARDAPKGKRELSKSIQDLSQPQAPAADHYSEKGMRPASSFDILTDGGTSSLRVKGERFVSLSYSSQLQSMGMKNIHGTLPKSNRFKLPPSELEQMFSPPTPAVANTGSVVEQLQQIMNSGMSADEKLQQAQLVLQASSAQQPPPSPFFLSGNLSNPRHSLSGDQSTCGLNKFYDLSPRVNGPSDWNKLSKKSYGSLTKSMPDLEEALRNTGARPKAPPAYDLSSALNGHASERSSQYNSSSTDRGQPGEIKSAREVRSAQRVGDWVEQHARTVHRHSQNLDADAETDDGYSEGSGDRQRRRPRKPRSDRKKEEGSSANNSQYGDLVDASRHQEEVESSLRRAQKILEEEEFNLNERKSKYAVDTDQREERRDGDLTPGMSFDESAELPDSPGLSLDSSKSERTVPSESTDRGYGSSTTQPSPSPRKAQNRKNTSSSRPELGRSSSSDSASTLTSMEASPTPDSPNARPFIGPSKNQMNERSSPLMTKERRKSILRQPILKPSSPKVPSIPSLQPQISTHVPIIKSQSNKHLKPSKSMQDLLSIDENDNEPVKLRQTGLKARQARRKRMLSLITFNSNDHTMHSDQLSTQSRRLSMETIVEVPKQEESPVHRESAEARANRRRRKRSDLKLGSGTNKSGLAISAEYASSSALDGDSSASQPESRSSGKQRPNSATEADKLGSMRKSQEAWDWNTKPGPTFNLVDSFRSKLSTHLKNAKDKVNENGTNSDHSQTNETLVTNGDACKSGADTTTEHTQMSKTNGLNDTADDIEELSGFDDTEAQKQQAKIRLRRDVPCLKGVGPSSSYTMRGTRGSQGSLPKQYIRKNSRVFDGFQSESSGDCSPGRAGKSATISSAAGHRLIADDAWSLYR